METISASQFGSSDKEGLRTFLNYCRSHAVSSGKPYIASISQRVLDMDPLAVLRSIHEVNQPHLYIEKRPISISGAEAIVQLRCDGPDRIVRCRDFIKDWSTRMVATGDLDADFSGPLFFCTFSFDANETNGGTVFLPKWQICRNEQGCVAVANVLVEPEVDVEPEVERVWRAHKKFITLDDSTLSSVPDIPSITQRVPESPELYQNRVTRAVEAIANRKVEKVVLSRWLDLMADSPFQPLNVLYRLRDVYPDCYAFSVSTGDESSWIGATPERLVRSYQDGFQTEAIAGSAPRGKNLAEDAQLGRGLLVSDKDRREHKLVVDSILRRLKFCGIDSSIVGQPQLLRLSNIQHLKTAIHGKRNKDVNLLEIAGALHPTPAVGGVPREDAVALQRELEPFSRGLYTGFFGWVSPAGEGEMVVALRTAHIEGNKARLYAGAGIVEGSHPEKEYLETEYKLEAMLSGLTMANPTEQAPPDS